MTEVSFKVVGLEKARKNECVVANVQFNGSEKVFTYVRKYNTDAEGIHNLVVDGCRIKFNSEYTVLSVERLYETKGQRKASTANQVGKGTGSKIQAEMESKGIEMPEVIPVVISEKPEVEKVPENGEIHHEMYDTIKTCLMANIPVYLAGPAGSGKNHTVEQIANELGWNFYFSNSVQQEFKLTGFIDAGGKFHETEFYKACTDDEDCVFFLDEMDASIPEVLVLLNAAIANGYFEFPNGRVNLKHVHFVAAGNTVGSGADEMYTGRMVLDQATLDRFVIVEFDYSRRIEMAISKNNTDLVEFIHELRNKANDNGIRATFSYRCITQVTKLEKAGMDLVMILKIAVFKGLDKDTINSFSSYGSTKYHRAFAQMKAA